ncbi:MAG TPA: hypothetical protein PK228_18345, partial [Saprospiraceae bacterium]|nr:hypothetical protein [Saprospiraceae bacterium]
MSKVYALNSIFKSALWLFLCCTVSVVSAENSPLNGDSPLACSISIGPASFQNACPDQYPNLAGGNYLISFTATPSGGGPYTHSWIVQNDGGTGASNANLSGANTATVTLNTLNLGYGTITLRYTVTGTCGTLFKDVTVETNAAPVTHVLPQWKCSAVSPGYSATWNLNSEISPIINNGGAWTVKYYNSLADAVADVNPFSNAQASNFNVSIANQTIAARITAPSGCWLSGPVYLNIWPAPSANPNAVSPNVAIGVTTALNGNPAGGGGGYTHSWARTGGTVPNGDITLVNATSEIATVSASSAGTINLRYTVTDINGCSATG